MSSTRAARIGESLRSNLTEDVGFAAGRVRSMTIDDVEGTGTPSDPWQLTTPPGTSSFEAYRDPGRRPAGPRGPGREDPAALPPVVHRGPARAC